MASKHDARPRRSVAPAGAVSSIRNHALIVAPGHRAVRAAVRVPPPDERPATRRLPPTAARRLATPIALLTLVAGCADRATGPNLTGLDPFAIARVTVTPAADTILVADTLTTSMQRRLVATVLLKSGDARSGVPFAWSSSDTAVVTVDTAGWVTPHRVGTARVRASAVEVAEATVVVAYSATRVDIAASAARVLPGDSVALTWRAFDAAGLPTAGIRFTASTSDGARATVDSTGRLRVAAGAAAGPVVVTVAGAGQTASVTIDVVERAFAPPAAGGAPASAVGLATGGDFTCGRLTIGAAVCWGRNDRNQLGAAAGDTVCVDDVLDPQRAPVACALAATLVAGGPAFTQVAAGGAHACGLDSAGAAYCWGASDVGQTGTGRAVTVAEPTAVATRLRFTAISAGAAHTCALATDGRAWCWGEDAAGQLGDGQHLASTSPTPVGGGHTFVQISAGLNHTCALDAGGGAYCWGGNSVGQLGIGTRTAPDTVVAVGGGLTFSRISAGGLGGGSADATGGVTCGVTPSGAAYCWGAGARGQLGTGMTGTSATPVLVLGTSYTAISVGGTHVCAVQAGEATCWGAYDLGLRGSVAIGTTATPTAVAPGQAFVAVSSGVRHSCGTAANGAPSCWGANTFGALGDGVQALVRQTPVPVQLPR